MRSLARVERYLESLLEGGFLRLFRSRLQPADLAKRLVRTMEEHQTLAVDRTFVPNVYTLRLAPADFTTFEPIRHTLERELVAYLRGHAARYGWTFVAPPRVTLEPHPGVRSGAVEVEAQLSEHQEAAGEGSIALPPRAPDLAATRPLPLAPAQDAATADPLMLVLSGPGASYRLPLTPGTVLYVGRDLDNDIILAHPSVSRRHARITRAGNEIRIEDLGSSNGTRHNGRRVSEARVKAGDDVAFGAVVLRVALAVEAAPAAAPDLPRWHRNDAGSV